MRIDMEWPGEWEDLILRGNVVVVLGAGKSGLTNLCNLIASMSPSYYIYGNTILKALPVGASQLYPMIRAAFLYDYVIPNVRGIRGCELSCAIEDKLLWSRSPEERINKLKLNLNSLGVLHYAAGHRACYVTDILDGCVRWREYAELFPDCHIIHLVRNGFDAISGRLAMHWDTPNAYRYPFGPSADWLVDGRPWYAEKSWDKSWNDATKIAHLWRVQVEALPPGMFYEKIMEDPAGAVNSLLEMFPVLSRTPTTQTVTDGIRTLYSSRPKATVTLDDIQEPERAKFKSTMERLGYL